MSRPVVHKRVVTNTPVYPKKGKPYIRQNWRQVLCNKPWSMIEADNDTITPYDEDTSCPDCLVRLGGRQESNRDVMRASKVREEFEHNVAMGAYGSSRFLL